VAAKGDETSTTTDSELRAIVNAGDAAVISILGLVAIKAALMESHPALNEVGWRACGLHPMAGVRNVAYFEKETSARIKERHAMSINSTWSAALITAASITFLGHDVAAQPAAVNIGTDSQFAILAGSGIIVAGAVNSTVITGNIGTFPTPSITGLGNVVLNGVNQAGDAVSQGAKTDLTAAFDDAAGRPFDATYSEVGGLTLDGGVYKASDSLDLTGTLTLNGQGNPNAVWIFQVGSSFTTASYSAIDLTGGAQASNVFWEVGSLATLGSYSDLDGDILALDSITMGTYATEDGRLLSENGAVTLGGYDTIDLPVLASTTGGGGTSAVPDEGSTLTLVILGLGGFLLSKFTNRRYSPEGRRYRGQAWCCGRSKRSYP
jgi:hypothetical protein